MSPYISNENRLSDVISAIQVMAVYKFYKLDFKGWADRICGDEAEAAHWKTLFKEHPEFFRLDQKRERASLVWRRTFPKNYNVDTEAAISVKLASLSEEERERISRRPLTNEDISTLMNTAIHLHSKALEQKQERRWWIPGVLGFAAGLVPFVLKLVFE